MSHRVLIPVERSPIAGATAILVGIFLAWVGVAIALDPGTPGGIKLLATMVTGSMALIALLGGRRFFQGSSGVFLNADGDLGFGLTGPLDIWWIPRASIAGVTVEVLRPQTEPNGMRWVGLLRLTGGGSVVLFEGDRRDQVEEIVQGFAESAGKLPFLPKETPTPRPTGTPGAIAIRRRSATGLMITILGAGLSAVAAALIMRTVESPLFGLAVGPPLALLGGTLLTIAGLKRVMTESLTLAEGRWTHRYQAGRLRWGTKDIQAEDARWRIRILGIRGAILEVIGQDGTIVAGAGATTRSRASVSELCSAVHALITPDQTPAGPPPHIE